MSTPTPFQSFLGGASLALPVHTLLTLNGSVFGISGFLHRSIRGNKEGIAAISGLVLGGIAVGALEGAKPVMLPIGTPATVLSGLLVGLGSKLSNGCTSGHMIAGISRFSPRSLVATTMFFVSGVITTRLFFGDTLLPVGSTDWSPGVHIAKLLALQLAPLFVSTFLYFWASEFLLDAPRTFLWNPPFTQAPTTTPTLSPSTPIETPTSNSKIGPAATTGAPEQKNLRLLALLLTGFNFAAALRLSNLSDPLRVISFLAMPLSKAFDPSLAFLAVGALPLAMALYRYGRGNEQPRLGGKWAVPRGGKVDMKLIGGAGLFGMGWGISGICPGPGLVNLGRAIVVGGDVVGISVWLASVVVGGLLA